MLVLRLHVSDAVGSDDCLRMQWNTTVLVSFVCHEHSHLCVNNVYTMHICMYVCMYVYGAIILIYIGM